MARRKERFAEASLTDGRNEAASGDRPLAVQDANRGTACRKDALGRALGSERPALGRREMGQLHSRQGRLSAELRAFEPPFLQRERMLGLRCGRSRRRALATLTHVAATTLATMTTAPAIPAAESASPSSMNENAAVNTGSPVSSSDTVEDGNSVSATFCSMK